MRHQRQALLLFGDEASFPQWGTLSYTWAPVGEQPKIKTSGKRKGYKVFGLIEYLTGQLFYQGQEGATELGFVTLPSCGACWIRQVTAI